MRWRRARRPYTAGQYIPRQEFDMSQLTTKQRTLLLPYKRGMNYSTAFQPAETVREQGLDYERFYAACAAHENTCVLPDASTPLEELPAA